MSIYVVRVLDIYWEGVSPATYESTTVRSVAVTPNPWSIVNTKSFAMVVADGGGSIAADKEAKGGIGYDGG